MKRHIKVITLTLLVVSLLMACNLTAASTQEPVIEPDTNMDIIPAAQSTFTPTDLVVAAFTATPTVNMDVVITADTGSLSIRRGPSIYYNVLGYLQTGQSSIATARDATGDWLFIAIPSNPSASGWVALGTQYSSLTGDPNTLEIKSVSPADPIFIKNCTYHPMQVSPLGTVLKPQTEEPNNLTQVVPGTYTVSDTSVNLQVAAQELFEGDMLIIYTDGLNNTYACP